MKILSTQQVLMLHQHLVEHTGGSTGLRNQGLLESALSAPFQSFGDTSAYPPPAKSSTALLWPDKKIICSSMTTSASAPIPCWFFWLSTA